MKTKYNDITPYPFLYKDKYSIVHCIKLEESPDNCYSCPCPDCYATCKPTNEEFGIMNSLHTLDRKAKREERV